MRSAYSLLRAFPLPDVLSVTRELIQDGNSSPEVAAVGNRDFFLVGGHQLIGQRKQPLRMLLDLPAE